MTLIKTIREHIAGHAAMDRECLDTMSMLPAMKRAGFEPGPGQRVSRLIDAQVSRLEPRITTWDAVADREAG